MLLTLMAGLIMFSGADAPPVQNAAPADCAECYDGFNITYGYTFHAHYECPAEPNGQVIICTWGGWRIQPWGGHQYGTGSCGQHLVCAFVNDDREAALHALVAASKDASPANVTRLRATWRYVKPSRDATRMEVADCRGRVLATVLLNGD